MYINIDILLLGEAEPELFEWFDLDLDLDDFESLLADLDLEFDFDFDLLLVTLFGLETLRERDREFEFWAFPLTWTGDSVCDRDLEREPFRMDSTDGDLELWLPAGEALIELLLYFPSKKIEC